jgi:NadR type nicotinamide-nucleotide adenylyltransferase
MSKRLVITGPESTGKSALAEHLARKLALPWAQEYARIHLEKEGSDYDFDLLLEISRLHKQYQMEQVPAADPLGIFDTDLINFKIWCDVVFGKCHPEIQKAMQAETNHVYLLCYPDLEWEADPLRENRYNRDELFDLHRQEIERLNRPYRIIRGTGPARFELAEKAAFHLLR